jgi:hypothetical protein
MIQDLSQTIRTALTNAPGLTPPLKDAHIVFDRPVDPFAPQQTTVDLFLYDVRENLELRNNEPTITRTNGQATIIPPPLRLACSYLVTAWSTSAGEAGTLQEQQLLAQVVQVLSRYPTIPDQFLQGSLVGQDPPMPMVTLHPDGLKNISEFWTSLGNKLRPSLTVTATIAVQTLDAQTAPMVITQDIKLQQLQPPGPFDESFRIGGVVTGANNAPIAAALVTLVNSGLVATTDAQGRYILGMVPSGNQNLRVQSGNLDKTVAISVPAAAGQDYNVTLP